MTTPLPAPRLLDPVAAKARMLHDSIRTEQAYIDWIRHFILLPNKKHPREMGAPEIEAFLSHLVSERRTGAIRSNGYSLKL